jgi:curved DNA-binding protein CbpA
MMGAMSDDPKGFYAALGVAAAAAPVAITTAFRRKARLLHPDVPGTGDAEAFMRVKAAYDVLGNPARRAAYDRDARIAIQPGPTAQSGAAGARGLRLRDLPIAVWAGVAGLFSLATVMAVVALTRPSPSPPPAVARPATVSGSSARVAPAEPPEAVQPFVGTATHYVLPAAGTTLLWRHDAERDAYVPGGHLADFTSVEALRLVAAHGLIEIRLAGGGSGYVDAGRLAVGDKAAARRAYCAYNAGPSPQNGAVLERHGTGALRLAIENRAAQPAVVKLRDAAGKVAISVFLAQRTGATVTDLPDGYYRPEFAVGELWSQACGSFTAGMRAQRFADFAPLAALSPLALPPELSAGAPPHDIPDAEFERE